MAKLLIKNYENKGDYELTVFGGQQLGDIIKYQLNLQQGIVIQKNGSIVNTESFQFNNDLTMIYYHNHWNDKNNILINIYKSENYFILKQYNRSQVIAGALIQCKDYDIIYNNIIIEVDQLYSAFNKIIKNEIGNADLFIVNKNFKKESQILITLYSSNILTKINTNDGTMLSMFRPKIINNIVTEKNSIVQSLDEKLSYLRNNVLLSEFGILNTHDSFVQLYSQKNQAILILIPLPNQETNTIVDEDSVLVRLWKFGNFLMEVNLQKNKTFREIKNIEQFIIVISGVIAAQNQIIGEFLKSEQKELNITLVDKELINNNQFQSMKNQEIFHELLFEKFLKNVFNKDLNRQRTPLSPILQFE